MDIKAIVCPAEDNGKTMEFYPAVTSVKPGNLKLWVNSVSSNYVFPYGNIDYAVTKFHFYDPAGRIYTINHGYFEQKIGEEYTKYRGISFKSKQKLLKRLKLSEGTYWEAYYAEALLFFISTGKTGQSKPRAEVYIPFSYLRNMGFKVEVTERHFINEYDKPEVLERAELITPMFFAKIAYEYTVKEVEANA